MNVPRPLTIVGGGLSGLALGLALRDRGVAVTVIEAGGYPRHRVCGEFLSGRGQEILGGLRVLEACRVAGARPAETALFATVRRAGPPRALPRPALCLSRHRLDALLAEELVQRGGRLRIGERVPMVLGQAGVVQATGRRVAPGQAGWLWFGVKAHALNVALQADLELHVTPNAYVGLCRLDADRVNVCGLFRRRAGADTPLPRDRTDWLRGPPGSPWQQRLAHASFDASSLCTVGGLDVRPHSTREEGVLRLGDALTMIPPLTGNGMSLALESAALAADPLAAYVSGKCSWNATCADIDTACAQTFRRRLRWAGWLQRLLFTPAAPALLLLTTGSDPLWRRLFAATRG